MSEVGIWLTIISCKQTELQAELWAERPDVTAWNLDGNAPLSVEESLDSDNEKTLLLSVRKQPSKQHHVKKIP